MKADIYTKGVLTVIACCLTYFVARDLSLVPEVKAQTGGVVDVNIVQVAGTSIDKYKMPYGDAFLPVRDK